jgi:probable rRNA maturation factor
MVAKKKTMSILIENRQKKISLDLPRIRRVIKKILNYVDRKGYEISLLFVDNEEIKDMNKRYLNRDYPTNVLSFSLINGQYGNINPYMLGDIVISVEKALEDAGEADIELNDEIDFLMIHGVLHLLDYNHEDTSEAEILKMNKKEKELLPAERPGADARLHRARFGSRPAPERPRGGDVPGEDRGNRRCGQALR